MIYETNCTDWFSPRNVQMRKAIRRELREAGFTSTFRNKRANGYTDKFYFNSHADKARFRELAAKLGFDTQARRDGGVILYLPNS